MPIRSQVLPRFALLLHEWQRPNDPNGPGFGPVHWDLLLEHRGELLCWALAQPVCVDATSTALRLPNHRLAYLEYEGPVEGDRGSVRRVDQGTFCWTRFADDVYEAELFGETLSGWLRLRREAGASLRWQLAVMSDENGLMQGAVAGSPPMAPG